MNVAVLRRGLKVGSQHLLSVRGRTTGLERVTPVSLVTVDGARYIVAAFADADWVKNGRAAGAARCGQATTRRPSGSSSSPSPSAARISDRR